jgi:hypothetical protein
MRPQCICGLYVGVNFVRQGTYEHMNTPSAFRVLELYSNPGKLGTVPEMVAREIHDTPDSPDVSRKGTGG